MHTDLLIYLDVGSSMPPEVSQFILESIFSMGSSWRILGFHGLNEAQGTSSYLAHSDVDSCQKDRHQYLVWCIYWKEKVVKWITWLELIGVWVSSTPLQAHIWWCRVKCAIWIVTYEVHGWYESSWSGFEYFEQEFIHWHFSQTQIVVSYSIQCVETRWDLCLQLRLSCLFHEFAGSRSLCSNYAWLL